MEAVIIARRDDVKSNEPPYGGFGVEWEDGFAVQNSLKYYLRVCDAEKDHWCSLRTEGYVWK